MDEAQRRKVAREVGTLIARRRMDAGLTQEEVARRLGIGNEAVSRLERGAAVPSIPRLFEFAEIFSCRIEDLLVPASERSEDQSADLSRHLDTLASSDRRFVLDMAKQLADHLQRNQKARAKRPSGAASRKSES